MYPLFRRDSEGPRTRTMPTMPSSSSSLPLPEKEEEETKMTKSSGPHDPHHPADRLSSRPSPVPSASLPSFWRTRGPEEEKEVIVVTPQDVGAAAPRDDPGATATSIFTNTATLTLPPPQPLGYVATHGRQEEDDNEDDDREDDDREESSPASPTRDHRYHDRDHHPQQKAVVTPSTFLRRFLPGGRGLFGTATTTSSSGTNTSACVDSSDILARRRRRRGELPSPAWTNVHQSHNLHSIVIDEESNELETSQDTSSRSEIFGDDYHSNDDHCSSNNSTNNTVLAAVQLQWLRHGGERRGESRDQYPGAQTRQGLPAPPSSLPSARDASNHGLASSSSPSQPNSTLSSAFVTHDDEETAEYNSALAAAWKDRRRRHHLMAYQHHPQPLLLAPTTPSYSLDGISACVSPRMDPRTGGFQQPHHDNRFSRRPAHEDSNSDNDQPHSPERPLQSQRSCQPPTGQQRQQQNHAVWVGPVDVDSGDAVVEAIVLRSTPPDDCNGGDDTMTVVSKQNSVASYPSVATSDMTPTVSNVNFHRQYSTCGGGAGGCASSVRATCSNQSLASGSVYTSASANVARPQPLPTAVEVHTHRGYADCSSPVQSQDTRTDHNHTTNNNSTSNIALRVWGGLVDFFSGGGDAAGDDSTKRGDFLNSRINNCREFLDLRTHHGKLAVTLTTIMVLAIVTVVVSASVTFQSGRSSNYEATPNSGAAPPNGTLVTPQPVVSPRTSSPNSAPAAAQEELTPTYDSSFWPTTSSRVEDVAPSSSTLDPSTPRPTDSLDSFYLPAVTTIEGTDAGSHFGTSVAMSTDGRILVVGAPEHLSQRGEVRVYHSASVQQEQWKLVTKLDGDSLEDKFGFDVALSSDGSILAVGAPGGEYGTVHTFALKGPGGTPTTSADPIDRIQGVVPGASFGHSVALSEDGFRLAVGAPYTEAPGQVTNGMVSVFQLVGDSWEPMGAPLVGEDNMDWLGFAVDLSQDGTMVIASAPKNREMKGYVRMWKWDDSTSSGSRNWVQHGPDIINNVPPVLVDRFGHSIALSESPNGRRPRVAVGSPSKTVGGLREAGMTLVYELNDNNNNQEWKLLGNRITIATTEILSSSDSLGAEFGNAVDLEGGILVVGIPGFDDTAGAVVVYRYRDSDDVNSSSTLQQPQWETSTELLLFLPDANSDSSSSSSPPSQLLGGGSVGDNFGYSLAVRRMPETDGLVVLVGALNNGTGSVTSFVKR